MFDSIQPSQPKCPLISSARWLAYKVTCFFTFNKHRKVLCIVYTNLWGDMEWLDVVYIHFPGNKKYGFSIFSIFRSNYIIRFIIVPTVRQNELLGIILWTLRFVFYFVYRLRAYFLVFLVCYMDSNYWDLRLIFVLSLSRLIWFCLWFFMKHKLLTIHMHIMFVYLSIYTTYNHTHRHTHTRSLNYTKIASQYI